MPPTPIALRNLPRRWYLGIRSKVAPPKIAAACAEALPRSGDWARKLGAPPVGAPILIYHAHLPALGLIDLQPAVFIPRAVEVSSPYSVGMYPAGEAAVAEHIGPYDKLGETHEAVKRFLAKMGKKLAGPCYDVYLTDPTKEKDPTKWKTEVVYPIG
ncbi:MAG: GyrI-like domain-containing protein [Candidatus Brocadiae bacterium]|nr:GyrI-like domain-containing protein [Candidatus Brocadiia bacterium]